MTNQKILVNYVVPGALTHPRAEACLLLPHHGYPPSNRAYVILANRYRMYHKDQKT